MSHDLQQAQQDLVQQALDDPRVAAAIRAYDAVRPFVPEQTLATVATTTYCVSTHVTPRGPREG
jgi:hypothetical protein